MKYIIPIIILSLFLLGCKKNEDDSTTTTELEGTWVTSCSASGSNYLKKTLIFSGSDVTDSWDYFYDSSCTSDNASESWVATYQSLSIGDVYEQSSYGTSGGSGHKTTKTIITNTVELKISDEVSWYNNNSYCGLTGWELNVVRDIAGKTCGSIDLWAKNTTVYGMYILDGNKLFPKFTSGSYADNVSSVDSNKYIKQ